MDAWPLLVPPVTIALAVLAWFRARKLVLPVLCVGAIATFFAMASVGAKYAPPEQPQTVAERAASVWSGVRGSVARRVVFMTSRRGPRDYAVFRNVRVVQHAAPVADPERPGRTLSDIVVCGEVATSSGGNFTAFLSAGDYTRLSSQTPEAPIDWSLCQAPVVLAPPDGERETVR